MLFTPEQAKILGVQSHDAGLLIERRGFLADGKAVEFTRSFYRGDTYDFVAELRIGYNDTLSAQVATLVRADWLFLMTDVDAPLASTAKPSAM